MKTEVLNGLLVARSLFDTARLQCFVRDRHVASSGLILLQDALELVLYCCLLEMGVDEQKSIESLTFDQLVGEFRAHGRKIIKSGTLKAMNKQRVLIKHHAQLAEPAAVQNYFEASLSVANALLVDVVGKPLQHIVIADAIGDPEGRALVEEAVRFVDSHRWLDAMISIRKLLFMAVESEYDIREWSNYDLSVLTTPPFLGKQKAPIYTRNKAWIAENVCKPTDYIQLDHAAVRTEMIELGIDPEEFFNVWRLTPTVYKIEKDLWAVEMTPEIEAAASEANVRYCLDVVVSIMTKQRSRRDIVRTKGFGQWKARMLTEQPLLVRASSDSAREGRILRPDDTYDAAFMVSGMDGVGQFVFIYMFGLDTGYHRGYIPFESCILTVHQHW